MTESPAHLNPQPIFGIRRNWKHLTTRPPSQQPVIDGVRAIAILWVICFHVVFFHYQDFPAEFAAIGASSLSSWTLHGDMGVDLFFVISGYLLGSKLFSEYKKSGKLLFARFYVRRFLRLIPVYIAAMALGILLLHNVPDLPKWGNAQNAWANFLYVNNFLPVAKQYMGWCWSLAIEEQFYILLPACILLFMRIGKERDRILLGLMLLSVVIRYCFVHFGHVALHLRAAPHTPEWNYWFDLEYDKPYTRFGGLLAGVGAAYFTVYRMPHVQRFFARRILVTFISLACLAVMLFIATSPADSRSIASTPIMTLEIWWTLYHDFFSLVAAFLILAAIHSPAYLTTWIRSFLSMKVFFPIAQLSYSLYLVHEMLFDWMFPRLAPLFTARFGARGTMAIDGAIALGAALILSTSLYIFVERPCMNLRTHPAIQKVIQFFRRPRLEVATEGIG